MVTVHMIGTFAIFLLSVELFVVPPTYPDINLSPLIMSQLPLIVAGYSLLASLFGCFIFRAIDMDSIMQLKWSGLGFGVYQMLVLFVQLLFSLMFGDILNKMGQGIFAGMLVLNFLATIIYLTVLFLYGKQLYDWKYGTQKLYRNSFGQNGLHENNWGVTTLPTLYSKELNIPNLNILQNHPSITRTNSSAVSITVNSSTSTEDDLEMDTTASQAETVCVSEISEETVVAP